MAKAGAIGNTWASGVKTWASGLREWMAWLVGDAAVPGRRARRILAATASVVVVLLVAVALTMGGGGDSATGGKHGAKHAAHPLIPTTPKKATKPLLPFSRSSVTTTTVRKPTSTSGAKVTPTTVAHPRRRAARLRRVHATSTASTTRS